MKRTTIAATALLFFGLLALPTLAQELASPTRDASTELSSDTLTTGELFSPVVQSPRPRTESILAALAVINADPATETPASPFEPPGRPSDRPPESPPGQNDPPNPPGRPDDRPFGEPPGQNGK